MTTKKIQDLYKELHEVNESLKAANAVINGFSPVMFQSSIDFKEQMRQQRAQLLEDIKEAQHEKLTK